MSGRPARAAMIAGTALAGAGMIALPALSAPPWAASITAVGLLLVAASLAGPLARWRSLSMLAGVTSVALATVSRPPTGILAATGLLILAYLLLLDAPPGMAGAPARRWLWLQSRYAAAGLTLSAVVAVMLTVSVPAQAWLAVAGAAAAVIAAAIALPRLPHRARAGREDDPGYGPGR